MSRKDPGSTRRLIERLIAGWAWFQSLSKAMKSGCVDNVEQLYVRINWLVHVGLRHKIEPQRGLGCFCVWIGHFRVLKTLTFKTRLTATNTFVWKWVLFAWDNIINGFALGLALNQRLETTRKWFIGTLINKTIRKLVRIFIYSHFCYSCFLINTDIT